MFPALTLPAGHTSPTRSYMGNNNVLYNRCGSGSTYYNLQADQYDQYVNMDKADNFNSYSSSHQSNSVSDNERFTSGGTSRFAGYFQTKNNTGNHSWQQQRNNGNLGGEYGQMGDFNKEHYYRGYNNENSGRMSDYINTALHQHPTAGQ